MQSTRQQILDVLSLIKGRRVLVVGDIMLDKYVWGETDRVSEEAPVMIIDVKRQDDRLGGAGNVVNNLLNLGAQVSLAGVIGADFEGEIVRNKLENLKVDDAAVIIDPDRPTTTKERVVARGQQVLRIDYEVRKQVSDTVRKKIISIITDRFEEFDAIIVSDYAKGVINPELMQLFSELKAQGKLSLKSRPLMVDPKPSNRSLYKGVNILKPNRKEAENISGMQIRDRQSALAAGKKIRAELNLDMLLLSLGADGLLVLDDENPNGLFSDTLARKVFDVSGAGDAVVSAFTLAICAGQSKERAADLANLSAADVVSQVGTVPVTLAGINEQLEFYTKKEQSK
jgi:rfaE bifunctional protein kinase chain/domain